MTNTDYDNSREWAAQAYALLKKQQEEQKQNLIDIDSQESPSRSSRDSGVRGSSPNLSNNSVTNPFRVSSNPLLNLVNQSISSIDI